MKIKIEVAYATPVAQKILTVEVDPEKTIAEIIELSGILQIFPEIDLTLQKVGVFSKVKNLTDVVQDGDRIEIYRPLTIDPKDARRKRAKG